MWFVEEKKYWQNCQVSHVKNKTNIIEEEEEVLKKTALISIVRITVLSWPPALG